MLNLGIPSRRSPLAHAQVEQLEIPLPLQRLPRREDRRIYEAVLTLRRRHVTVYRRGRFHYVDGRQLTNRQLLKVARS